MLLELRIKINQLGCWERGRKAFSEGVIRSSISKDLSEVSRWAGVGRKTGEQDAQWVTKEAVTVSGW